MTFNIKNLNPLLLPLFIMSLIYIVPTTHKEEDYYNFVTNDNVFGHVRLFRSIRLFVHLYKNLDLWDYHHSNY